MPLQGNQESPQYGNQDIVKILASPEFQSAPAELQRQVRERLGITAPSAQAKPATPPDPARGTRFEGISKVGNFILGRGPQYQNKTTLLEDLENSMRKTAATRQSEDSASPSRSPFFRTTRQYAPLVMADVAKYTRGALGGKSAALGAASLIPQARPIIGAYGAMKSGKELFIPQPGESDADRLERILSSLSGVAGSVALGKSGRLGTAKSEMESRIAKATYASGSTPGTPNAFRMTIPDIMETVSTRKLPLKSVSDLAKAVEATNERFNTQTALAEQPFAGDQIIPSKAADALEAAARELPPSAAAEAAEMRAEATNYRKPWSLRDIGKEMRQQNKLWGSHGGKTSLELSTAKTRASVAINDILRKSLRDTYMDYLESKHPGSGLRDMRMRQEQILNLRDTLGEYNKSTGKVEKGQAEKLEAAQAKFKGGPGGEDIHGVASQHGIRGYIKLPKVLRRGPETQANSAVRKAFNEDIGHRIPRRQLGPLAKTKRAPETEPDIESLRRGASGEPPAVAPERDVNTAARVKDRVAEAKAHTESLKRQAAVAGKKHPEWAERIRAAEAKADAAAKSGGDPEAARLKKLAKPKGDTSHLARATEELFPGKKFNELTPAEQSQAVQRSLELKFGSTKKPPADESPATAESSRDVSRLRKMSQKDIVSSYGKLVRLNGEDVTVVAFPAGKVTVRMPNGSTKTVYWDELEGDTPAKTGD